MRPERRDLIVISTPSSSNANSVSTLSDARDGRGRFQVGNSGGPGRPRGSRNRLGEDFIASVYEDWCEHGPAVLARVREQDPSAYLRIAASLVPSRLESEPVDEFATMSKEQLWAVIVEGMVSFSQDEHVLAALAEKGFTLRRLPQHQRRKPSQ